MIVDFHTHVWDVRKHLSEEFLQEMLNAKRPPLRLEEVEALPERHFAAMANVDRATVLAFKSATLGFHVPNEYVAEYVKQHPEKLIGFASVDPNEPSALEELEYAVRQLGMKGLKLSPVYQDFHPLAEDARRLYQFCEREAIPVMVHAATTFARRAPLRHGSPLLWEDVALDFPGLKIVLSHLAHPWMEDCIVVIRKQPNVYADISAIWYRPWQFYNGMVLAYEYGVMHKLLFGSDYPFTTPEATFEACRNINRFAEPAGLPQVPVSLMEEIVHRETLRLLGIDIDID